MLHFKVDLFDGLNDSWIGKYTKKITSPWDRSNAWERLKLKKPPFFWELRPEMIFMGANWLLVSGSLRLSVPLGGPKTSAKTHRFEYSIYINRGIVEALQGTPQTPKYQVFKYLY